MADEGQSSRNPRKRVRESLLHEPREHSTSKHNEVLVRSTGPLPVQSCRAIITQTKRDSYFKAWHLLATTVVGLACSTRLVRMASNQCQRRPFIRLHLYPPTDRSSSEMRTSPFCRLLLSMTELTDLTASLSQIRPSKLAGRTILFFTRDIPFCSPSTPPMGIGARATMWVAKGWFQDRCIYPGTPIPALSVEGGKQEETKSYSISTTTAGGSTPMDRYVG